MKKQSYNSQPSNLEATNTVEEQQDLQSLYEASIYSPTVRNIANYAIAMMSEIVKVDMGEAADLSRIDSLIDLRHAVDQYVTDFDDWSQNENPKGAVAIYKLVGSVPAAVKSLADLEAGVEGGSERKGRLEVVELSDRIQEAIQANPGIEVDELVEVIESAARFAGEDDFRDDILDQVDIARARYTFLQALENEPRYQVLPLSPSDKLSGLDARVATEVGVFNIELEGLDEDSSADATGSSGARFTIEGDSSGVDRVVVNLGVRPDMFDDNSFELGDEFRDDVKRDTLGVLTSAIAAASRADAV